MKLRHAWICAAALAGCILEKDPGNGEGPSTETGNPNLRGTLVEEGRPVAGSVKLYRLPPPSDSSALIKPVLISEKAVAADGRYRFDSLPPANYALEAAAAGKNALLTDLALAGPKDTLIRDLDLRTPARILGRATRGPNARPAGIADNENILVRVGGADRSATTDTAGDFVLENVPAGAYRLAFAAADGHYLTRYLDPVAAGAGAEVHLPPVDLEWSRYVAPPAVAGLAAAWDSVAHAVRLSWRSVELSGGAEVRYQVTRSNGPQGDSILYTGTDTAYADALTGFAASPKYGVVALNPLGQKGPASATPPVTLPGPDTAGPGSGSLSGVVLAKTAPQAGVRVRLYRIPAAPGSPNSLPVEAKFLDSALTDASGRYAFTNLPSGRYTIAAQSAANAAIRTALSPRASAGSADTLRLEAAGSVSGSASRDSLWVSAPFKGDENIRVSLAGTPYAGATDYGSPPAGGPFALAGVAPGAYKLVVYATPEGFFLPDTLDVTVTAGLPTKLPSPVKARYNPSAPPPKITGLKLASATRTRVNLTWPAVARYAPLKGYRVMRLDADLAVLDSSAVIPVAAYSDDVSAVAAGTRLKYVVRVVNDAGREGENGGDAGGLPVEVGVPSGP